MYDEYIWRRTEEVITGLTRNQFTGVIPVRGFESLRLRFLYAATKISDLLCARQDAILSAKIMQHKNNIERKQYDEKATQNNTCLFVNMHYAVLPAGSIAFHGNQRKGC